MVRFRKVLVQIPSEVPAGSGTSTLFVSGGFWCKYLERFWRVLVQMPGEVVGGSGEGFRYRDSVRFRRLPVQIPAAVSEGSGDNQIRGFQDPIVAGFWGSKAPLASGPTRANSVRVPTFGYKWPCCIG